MKIVKDIRHTLHPLKPSKYGQYAPWLEVTFWFSCAYCLKELEKSTVDHFLPKNTYKKLIKVSGNLLPSCHECQEQKGSYDPKSKRSRNGVRGVKLFDISKENLKTYFDIDKDGNLVPLGKNVSRQLGMIALFKLDLRAYLVEMRRYSLELDTKLKEVIRKKNKHMRLKDLEKVALAEETIELLKKEKLKYILLNLVFEYDVY